MPSPLAHAMSGAAIYLALRETDGVDSRRMAIVAFTASLHDLDLLPGLLFGAEWAIHRVATHSLAAALLFSAGVYALLGARPHASAMRMWQMLSLAYLSHLLLDWVSYDDTLPQGIAIWWPLSTDYYMAKVTIFNNVVRHDLLAPPVLAHNALALLWEAALIGPLLWWTWRRRAPGTLRS